MGLAKAVFELCPQGQWVLHGEEVYDNIQWLSDDITMPTEAEVNAKIAELEAGEPMRLLRERRDELLEETDWVTLKAYSQGVSVPTEWATYQQALRDLPANTTDPANPTWPTKPA